MAEGFEADFESTVQAQLDPRTGVELAVIVEIAIRACVPISG
jgi:hypothetical protein